MLGVIDTPRPLCYFSAWPKWRVYSYSQGCDIKHSSDRGGSFKAPTYTDVGSGTTGCVEVVEEENGPSKVLSDELLNVFWEIRYPTTLNRQSPDVGTEYRSTIIFYTP